MVLNFAPPQDLINAYLNRPSPGEIASQGIGQALQTYAQQKIQQEKVKKDALDTLLKASESVDLSDPATAKAFAPLYKNAGVDPTIFQPPTSSTGTIQTTEIPSAQENLGTQPPQISPIIQASLDHPDHQKGLTPEYIEKMSKTGYGRKVIASKEAGQKLLDAQTKTKEASDAMKIPFEDVQTTFQAANESAIGNKLIDDAKAAGLDHVPSKKLDYALKGLGVKNAGMRGGAIDSIAETRRLQLRDSLIKEARSSMNPYFQSGAGKEQAQRLNAIGRADALIGQMLNQPSGGDPRQMRELAVSIDRVLKGGGVSAQNQIEELVPSTARGKFANWLEWFSNEPQGREQQAFIKRYKDTLDREKGQIQSQVKSVALSAAPTLRVLKDQYPDDYQATVDSILKNPDLVGENSGEVIRQTKDGRKAVFDANTRQFLRYAQ